MLLGKENFRMKFQKSNQDKLDNEIQKRKVEFIKFCVDNQGKLKSKLPIIKIGQKLEAILIEFRLIHYIPFILENAIHKLGDKWSFTIVCGNSNVHMFRRIIENLNRKIRIIQIPVNNLTREEYSIMLLQSDFYRRFEGEKLLVMQEDTLIFESLPEKFLEYDYIGAPFSNYQIGNGGLSLRDKGKMIEVCERYFDKYRIHMKRYATFLKKNKPKLVSLYGKRYFNHPELYYIYELELKIIEDFQITEKMRKNKIGKLPSFNIGKEFSIEKFYHPKSFGGHQFWYCVTNIYEWLSQKLEL